MKREMRASAERRFEDLLANHSGIVFRVVRTYSRHPDDQQDLAQEIKLQLWRAFGKYDSTRQFSTWMYRIALNTAITWSRRTHVRHHQTVPLEEIGDQTAPPDSGEDVQALYQLIDSLASMDRALLLLSLDDLSNAEIGDILGITPGNVATKVSRRKEQLRQQLNHTERQEWN